MLTDSAAPLSLSPDQALAIAGHAVRPSELPYVELIGRMRAKTIYSMLGPADGR